MRRQPEQASCIGPGAPVNAQARQTLLPAITRQPIEKGVSRRIVALPRCSQQRGGRGKEDHEVERKLLRQFV